VQIDTQWICDDRCLVEVLRRVLQKLLQADVALMLDAHAGLSMPMHGELLEVGSGAEFVA
jgi:hypothetical protein